MNFLKPTIGFFGGTFDPIHYGHLSLAINLMEAHDLKEVWFCPTFLNPFRQTESPMNSLHRLKMVSLAIRDIPQFKLLDIECQSSKPSYTYDTIKSLLDKEHNSSNPRGIAILLGEDNISEFYRWKNAEELIQLVPLYVGKRSNALDNLKIQGPDVIQEAIRKGITNSVLIDISSTNIRHRLKSKLYCGHLIPGPVLEYIYNHHLYGV